MKKLPSLQHEIRLWKQKYTVIGIDEVGRGAFAGPLVVAGVVFDPKSNIKYLESLGINDSKKLTPSRRESLSEVIHKMCFASHISTINVACINRVGIGRATFMAMRDVVKNLMVQVAGEKVFVLVDGFYVKHMRGIGLTNQKAIVGGDGISISIAAASIIAKVYRDNLMLNLAEGFPNYMWRDNKGYGTAAHRLALKDYGRTKLHRRAFVKNFL